MFAWVGAEAGVYRFAVEHSERGVRLAVALGSEPPSAEPPPLVLEPAAAGTRLGVRPSATVGRFTVTIDVPDPPADGDEDELTLAVRSDAPGVPPCRLVLRRTCCRISAGLVQRDARSAALRPETRAALLWHAWGRYAELVGLRRFTTGTSASDVMVFRPRLRNPATRDPVLVGAEPLDVMGQAWGASLLVKTGAAAEIHDEWERFRLFLADRLHPFMARIEACLDVRAPGDAPDGAWATLVGPFVGGDLLQAETLESVLRGPADADAVEEVVRRLFAVTGSWYASGARARLGNWWKMLRPAAAGPPALSLFGRYELGREEDRRRLSASLAWDGEFASREHLAEHLLGAERDGLLHRLAELPVRYSLVHGDLHVRNILVAADHVSLLDFGGTAIAPTLFDFARLEVFARMWGLDVGVPDASIEGPATRLETLLLDHFTATEGGLQPVPAIAGGLGVPPGSLLKVVRCLAAIRRAALPYCVETPDRRDYLAVLYLTVFHALRFAGRGPEPLATFRWLMALFWVLEDALSRIVGLTPFQRRRQPPEPERLLDAAWLGPAGAPGRVRYWLERPEGRLALAPLAATRGVLQGAGHALDVLDETLLTLGYLEAILGDPVGSLLDPGALERRVRSALSAAGLALPLAPAPPGPERRGPAAPTPAPAWARSAAEAVRQPLIACLDPEARLAVKWAALFQNTGKPATRVVVPDPGSGRGGVRFPGYEDYGVQLIQEPLRHAFPSEAQRAAVARLIAAHPRHLAWLARAAGPARLAAIARALAGEEGRAALLAEAEGAASPGPGALGPLFPLCVLHGYAAALAGRGAPGVPPVDAAAALAVALLAAAFDVRRPAGAG